MLRKHRLVNFVSGNIHLAKSKFVMIFVIQNVHQVCIKRMNILTNKQQSQNFIHCIKNLIKINTLLVLHHHNNNHCYCI